MWLNKLICFLVGTHIPRARLKLDAKQQRMVAYWECDRCGKDLTDE